MAPSGRGSFMLPLKVETQTCKEVNLVVKSTQLRVEIIALFKAPSSTLVSDDIILEVGNR